MERDKQIEEIAKLICTYPQCIHYNIIGGCTSAECQTADVAERLYAAGYRKQSEGEWVRSESKFGFGQSRCSICDGYVEGYTSYRFCPHCGAKIVGIKEEKIQ